MLTSPYSIYINKRPLRVTFFIEDKPKSLAIIDTILAYNRDRWGGRYNPIVITDGQTLTDAWWSLLEAVDPDVVKSFVPLGDDLVDLLERRVSPYLIQQPDRREQEEAHRHIDLLHDGLSLLPMPLNVRRASWAIGESSLVLFETDWRKTDPLIKRFIEWNFGGYSPPIHAVSRALEGVRTQPYPVTDAASLVGPLTELSTLRAYTYPIQLCSLPKEALPDVERDPFSETFHPERYPTIIGRELWWQLPRLNSLASHMFQRPSRILRTRFPSVLMKCGEPRLDITLPDDLTVFASLAALPNQPYYAHDTRYEKGLGPSARRPYSYARRSDKGRYLSGLLDLFGGLGEAADTLSQRYWRRMFDLLSGRTADADAARLQEVGNALRKRLRANRARFYEDDKAMTWLMNRVLKVARSLPASSRDLEFSVFENQAKKEAEDFNARGTDQAPWVYSRAQLVNALAGLTERRVLLMGIQARCPSCGYRAWHHIDDAKQTLRCGGCNAGFPMPPEPRWHYRLNSLARAAYASTGYSPSSSCWANCSWKPEAHSCSHRAWICSRATIRGRPGISILRSSSTASS